MAPDRRRTAFVAAAAALALAVAALLAVRGARPAAGTPAADPRPGAPPPLAAAAAAPEPARPERPPPGAGTAAAGHARIAEALGLVAIRCWVGPEHDTDDLVGAFHQVIEAGWYSNVVTRLEGAQIVERRYDDAPPRPGLPASVARAEFETLFDVRWRADAPGTEVPCTVVWPTYAELTVTVRDAAGAAVPGASVIGCGGVGDTDAAGQLVLQARAGEACDLRASTYRRGEARREGRVAIAALAEHEARDVGVTLAVAPPPAPHREEEDDPAELWGRLDDDRLRADLEAFRRLRVGATGSEARLLEHLVDHREDMLAASAVRKARREALDAAFESGDPAAIRAAMDALTPMPLPPTPPP